MGHRRIGRKRGWWMGLCVLVASTGLGGRAHAHLGSTKYLDVTETEAGARVIVALDADDAGLALGLGLAPSDDALRSRGALLEGWLAAGLSIERGGQTCDTRADEVASSLRDGRRFVEVPLDVSCAARDGALVLRDDTVFEDDPDHRAFVTIHGPRGARTAVLRASSRELRIEREETASAWATVATFVVEGAWHLVTGLDHVLFVLTLLLGGALPRLRRRTVALEGRSPITGGSAAGHPARPPPPVVLLEGAPLEHPAPSRFARRRARFARSAFREAAWLVTAFTVGHSISLCAAALGWVSLPSGPVELAIAASVVIAAAMSSAPRSAETRGLAAARPVVALAFGVLHGFGFASVLGDVGLPASDRVIALLSFNVGIELAQLALVAIALPILGACGSLLRARGRERAVALSGSLAIAAVALVWVVERAAAL